MGLLTNLTPTVCQEWRRAKTYMVLPLRFARSGLDQKSRQDPGQRLNVASGCPFIKMKKGNDSVFLI